jgi:hypothetical protein
MKIEAKEKKQLTFGDNKNNTWAPLKYTTNNNGNKVVYFPPPITQTDDDKEKNDSPTKNKNSTKK